MNGQQKTTETTQRRVPTEKDMAAINQQIGELKERAKQSSEKAKEAIDTQIRAVEDNFDLVVARLNKKTKQFNAATDEVQSGLTKAWMNLEDSINKAKTMLQ